MTTARAYIKRADKARNFPHNTCPASRHAQIIGEMLIQKKSYPMLHEEPEHCGETILSVVTSLYLARTEIEKLKKKLLRGKEERAKVLAALNIGRIVAQDDDGNYTREITPKRITEAIAIMRKEPEPPTVKESFTVAEQSRELDAGMAAQHYCRGLWGAARGHSDWRKVHEHFANGYKQGCHDNEMAQGPYPWPDDPLDLELRGLLASKLKCWHRLSGPEATELVALFEGLRQKEPEPISDADAMGFAVMEHLGPSALTGGTMTILEAFELGWNARALLEKTR